MKKSPFHLQTIKWEDFCSIHSSTTTVGYHIKSVPGSVSMAPFQPLSSSPGVSSRNTSSPRTSSESHRHPAIELVPRSKDCPWISILGIFFWNPGSSKLRPDIFLVARKKVKYSLHGNYRGRKNCLGGLDCEFWTSCNVNMTLIKGIAIKKFSGAPNTTKSIRPKSPSIVCQGSQ